MSKTERTMLEGCLSGSACIPELLDEMASKGQTQFQAGPYPGDPMTILQRTITGSVIYSHFRYLCPYHTWLLFHVGLPEVVPAPSDRLLMASGIRHEEEALKYFQKEYGDGCAVIRGEEGLRDEEDIRIQFERTVLRSKGVLLSNHFKRWYFHVKGSQRMVEATALAQKPL
jgi:hypothetical protein